MFTQEEGIKLLEYAGFTVEVLEYGFRIFENGKKIHYCSNSIVLKEPQFLMKNFIKKHSFNKGFKEGQKVLKIEINNLLKIN